MRVLFAPEEIAQMIAESESRRSHTSKTGAMDHTTKGSRAASEMGIFGEAAVQKITGYKASGFRYSGRGKAKDVGPLQVRATERHLLYFKDFENPYDPYVGVQILGEGAVEIIGWRFGFECQKDKFRREPQSKDRMRPGQECWWQVPHSELYSLLSLENWCVSHGYAKWHASGLLLRRDNVQKE